MDILISAGIGCIIGYFTNWLAIKMLFRPLEEKYIFGFKLPFTPGLIPKEKNRIAKSVGMTIEEYLLTPETIIKSVERDEDKFKNLVLGKIKTITDKNYRIKDLLSGINERERTRQKDLFKNKLKEEALKFAEKMDLGKSAVSFLEKNLKDKDNLDKLSKGLVREYKTLVNSEETRSTINTRIRSLVEKSSRDERYLREVVNDDIVDDIKGYIDENHKILLFKIRRAIGEEKAEKKIKSIIRKLVQSNISGLIASFIPMDKVEEKGYTALEDYLASEEGARDLQDILKLFLDNLLDMKIKDIMANLSDTVREELITKHLVNGLSSNDLLANIEKIIENQVVSLDLDFLYNSINAEVDKFINSDALWSSIFKLVDNTLEVLENMEINKLLESLDLDGEKIYVLLRNLFDRFIKNDMEAIIKNFNIAKIVEDTIHTFDDEFTEKLILDIASQELKAITVLGGVLGALIGVLNPIIQRIII